MDYHIDRPAPLDPKIKALLQEHLKNTRQRTEASPLKMGTLKQLSEAVKVSSSAILTQCFWQGTPYLYPSLPKHNYLVACVDLWFEVQVVAIYSLQQMKHLHTRQNYGLMQGIVWGILELSVDLEQTLGRELKPSS
jgi:hypothetical protein